MIILRRPVLLYDVDLLGVVALVILALGAIAFVYLPVGDADRALAALKTELQVRQGQADITTHQLDGARRDNDRLAAAVETARRGAPDSSALTRFVSVLSLEAAACGIEITQVRPSGVEMQDGLLVGRLTVIGQGRGADFLRLLDALARENRHQAVADASMTKAPGIDGELCALTWTHQIRMLPDGPSSSEGTTP